MAELILRNIRKTFTSNTLNGSRVVLGGIDLEVSSGDFVALVGPSGCGKTTLLKVIAGLVPPDPGDFELSVNGKPIKGPGPDRSLVFQNYNSYPWLTVFQNVQFGLQFMPIPHDEQRKRAEAYLNLVGLWEYRDEYPKVLSGGQLQRVAIARTLATDPKVILMDEPFAALDAQTREGMQAELLDIQRETRATIVFVTHDIYEAAFLGNHVYVLSRLPARIIRYVDARNTRDLILKAFNIGHVSRAAESLAVERERVRYEPRFLDIQKELREALQSEPNTTP
jgi:NitT/TauT family transport system ATP-binding protein